jgi:hypothetical protein
LQQWLWARRSRTASRRTDLHRNPLRAEPSRRSLVAIGFKIIRARSSREGIVGVERLDPAFDNFRRGARLARAGKDIALALGGALHFERLRSALD